jgi:hypothetical protein
MPGFSISMKRRKARMRSSTLNNQLDASPFHEALEGERQYQRENWKRDSIHTGSSWGLLILERAGMLATVLWGGWLKPNWEDDTAADLLPVRRAAIKLAACCYAIVDSIDAVIDDETRQETR